MINSICKPCPEPIAFVPTALPETVCEPCELPKQYPVLLPTQRSETVTVDTYLDALRLVIREYNCEFVPPRVSYRAPVINGKPITGNLENDYTFAYRVVYGEPPYTFTIQNGLLPPGLSLNETTGEITGTPLEEGRYNFNITVRDVRNRSNTLMGVISIYENNNTVDPEEPTNPDELTVIGYTGETFQLILDGSISIEYVYYGSLWGDAAQKRFIWINGTSDADENPASNLLIVGGDPEIDAFLDVEGLPDSFTITRNYQQGMAKSDPRNSAANIVCYQIHGVGSTGEYPLTFTINELGESVFTFAQTLTIENVYEAEPVATMWDHRSLNGVWRNEFLASRLDYDGAGLHYGCRARQHGAPGGANWSTIKALSPKNSGKKVWEFVHLPSVVGTEDQVAYGICAASQSNAQTQLFGETLSGVCLIPNVGGTFKVYVNGSLEVDGSGPILPLDVITFAADFDSETMLIKQNGTLIASLTNIGTETWTIAAAGKGAADVHLEVANITFNLSYPESGYDIWEIDP